MAFFLLVYDQTSREVLQLTEYGDAERGTALEARFDLERRHRLEPSLEVVLLGARDEATLHRTHARYFSTLTEMISQAR